MTDHPVADNISKVRHRIRLAAQKFGRPAGAITLLAVSKTRPAEALREAWQAGEEHFGENYVQEAMGKMALLRDLPLCWHFIGPVQSNKTRDIACHFDWIHSVERLKIARRLSEQRPANLPPLQLCLQVNISGESSKSGVDPGQLQGLADAIAPLPALQLRGLMAIPAPEQDFERQRAAFASLRRALELLQQSHPSMDTLSMGMSADLEAAIAEGATIVRVGTDIFGPRER